MQRNIFALIVGTALLGGAALAACSSGGGTAPTPAVNSTTTLAPGNSQLSSTNGTTFTFTINRSPVTKTHKKPQSARRNAKTVRKPDYISRGTEGLQIAVTASATTGVTKYADVSSSSVLCSGGLSSTCTITVPTIAATEKITVTEVDQLPNHDGTNGNPAGYGDGFPSNTNILAVGSATSTTNSGAITIGLSPVLAMAFDSEDCDDSDFATVTPSSTVNAGWDEEGPNLNRIVVTGGVAQTLIDEFCFFDADFAENYEGGTPLPVVDVNGSATPVTATSNSQHILIAMYNDTSPPPVPSTQTGSMPDTSMIEEGNCIGYVLMLDGNLTQPATITLSNNLTAANPFTGTNYAASEVTTIVPLLITATPSPISQGAGTPTTVVASDYQGTGGLTPFASVNSSGVGASGGDCLDSGSTVRATVTNVGSINTSTWLQTFSITPAATPTVTSPVTCTFVLADVNTNSTGLPGYVVTPTITVIVNP